MAFVLPNYGALGSGYSSVGTSEVPALSYGNPRLANIPSLVPLDDALNYGAPVTDYSAYTQGVEAAMNPVAGNALDYGGGNAAGGWGDWLNRASMFGGTDAAGMKTSGWVGPALGMAQGLMSGWMGMKQFGLMKKQLAESKRQFNMNYDAQRTNINSQLEDRQRARVASNPGAYQSVGDYMNQNRVK